jgi:ANTAR domain
VPRPGSQAGPYQSAHASGTEGAAAAPARSDTSAAAQIARVETLLDALCDMMSSLVGMNMELGREVMTVLHRQAEGGQAPGDETVDALRKENAQLKEALEGRSVIERAKGMLMVSHRCDEEAAFQTLVTISRQQRRKVRDVAADIAISPPSGRPPLTLQSANRSRPQTSTPAGNRRR